MEMGIFQQSQASTGTFPTNYKRLQITAGNLLTKNYVDISHMQEEKTECVNSSPKIDRFTSGAE